MTNSWPKCLLFQTLGLGNCALKSLSVSLDIMKNSVDSSDFSLNLAFRDAGSRHRDRTALITYHHLAGMVILTTASQEPEICVLNQARP